MGVLPDNALIEARFFSWLWFLKLALKWIVIGSAIVPLFSEQWLA
jgi:hypothetical protein